jgi:YD repeat-containing protein
MTKYLISTELDANAIKNLPVLGTNADGDVVAGSGYVPYTGASSDVDLGSRKITTKEILTTAPITLTYNGSGQLTQVAKTGGTTKTLTYNGDGTLNTLNDGTRTKTFNWSGGVLQSVSIS